MADTEIDATAAMETGVSDHAEIKSTADANAESLELDDVFHILQNERRRNVLRYLQDVDDVIEMRDMAVQIAAWENDTTVQQLHSDQRQRVYIALYQSHLPKLDKLGLIEYNKPRGYVETRPRLDDVHAYLDPEPVSKSPTEASIEESSPNGGTALLGATGAASLLVTAGWLGMTPALLSGVGVAAAVLMLYVATIAFTYRSDITLTPNSDN